MHQNKLGTDKKIKLFIKNKSFQFAHKVAIRRLKRIVKNSVPAVKGRGGKKILFNLIYGMYGKLIYWECGLAKALQMRGHDVKVMICGKAFTMCTTEYTVHTVHDDITCKHCVDFSQDFFNVADMPYSTYNDYVSKDEMKNITDRVNNLSIDECRNLVYKEVNVGALSMNSVKRYFKGSLNPDKDEYESVLRSELINAIIATDAAEKVVQEEKPDVLVTRHMGYSSWGSFAEYCINKGIRVCYAGTAYKENTITFDIVRTENFFNRYYEKLRKKKPLNKQEEIELQLFLDKRIEGREGDTALYGFSTDKIGKGKNLFDFDKYDKTYAIFPNVAWDSSLLNAHKGFKDVYEWVCYTIDLFKHKPDCQLLLKVHPSEVSVLKSENTILDYIHNNFSSIPENIKIIPPDTDISPYALFPYIDVGILYNGTIGLEMILKNIPVVVAGRAHYGEKGFTSDVSTKKEYEDILFSDIPSLKKQTKQLARVYAYFYFIKSFVPYDLITRNRYTKTFGWNIKSLDDFAEGKNKYLDHICNYLTEEIIYQDW